MRASAAIGAVLTAGSSGLLLVTVACSPSSGGGTTPFADSGSGRDANGGSDTGTTVSSDSGSDASPAPPQVCMGTADLYHRLGCEAGITMAVQSIAAAELANGDIATYFVYAGTPGHPNDAQIEACLVNFLSNAVGGPDPYPSSSTSPPLVVDAGGSSFSCRPMAAAHADLYISGGSFDTFVAVAAGVLMGAPFDVSPSDLLTLEGPLNGLRPSIVPSYLADAGLETLSSGIEAALDAGIDAHEQ